MLFRSEHAVILSDGQPLAPEDFPSSLTTRRFEAARPTAGETAAAPATSSVRTLQEIEKEVIFAALERHQGDKPKVAAELGIALKTLYNKLNQYQAEAGARAG